MYTYLFSYGTLQLEKVQIETFGRKLNGTKETLEGFTLGQLQITDASVLEKSKQEYHPIAIPSFNTSDIIIGTLYKISVEELEYCDTYEVSDYKRIKAVFVSGKKGWVYVKA